MAVRIEAALSAAGFTLEQWLPIENVRKDQRVMLFEDWGGSEIETLPDIWLDRWSHELNGWCAEPNARPTHWKPVIVPVKFRHG